MMRLVSILFAMALLVGGCAGHQAQGPCTGAPGELGARLVEAQWVARGGGWFLHHAGYVETHGRRFPMQGYMQLDLDARTARLVAVGDFGLKLFSLRITTVDVQVESMVPELQKFTGLAQGIAASVRQMYLNPMPGALDAVSTQPDGAVLCGERGEGQLRSTFDAQGHLVRKAFESKKSRWLVNYEDYAPFAGLELPQNVMFEDNTLDYRLHLKLVEARRVSQ